MNITRINFYIVCLVLLFPLFAEKDISIITNPAGAGVYFDGKKIGMTPLTFSKESSDLPLFKNPGKSYDFILYKDFFEGEIISVTYDLGKKNQFKMDLQYLTRLPLYDGIFQADYTLNFYELLISTMPHELAALRNEIYAKYGGKLDSDYKETIGQKSWYKENPYFSESFFSETDASNLELIHKIEFGSEEDEFYTQKIINTSEYTNSEITMSFGADLYVNINYNIAEYQDYESESPYGYFSWRVVENTVYIWDTSSEKLYYVVLNHDYAEIEQLEDISYEYWMPYGEY